MEFGLLPAGKLCHAFSPMVLSSVLTPFDNTNLRLAAQCGVEGIVLRYPAEGEESIAKRKQRVESCGMKVTAVEGYLPMERIKRHGSGEKDEWEKMRELLEGMGELGIPLLCYHFMVGTDWVRTKVDVVERGGALVTGFDLVEAERAVALNYRAENGETAGEAVPENRLRANLECFLERLLPIAEKAGVALAMHPDDPPLPEFAGQPRIMRSVEDFEWLMSLSSSPHNTICFCQGTFAAMGCDIGETIRRLGSQISYVHFRDVRGTADSFVETFHDNGPTDMGGAIRALREAGFTGPIRPDHVPQLEGEEDGDPGYTMLGRLFAFGYIRGLLQGSEPAGGNRGTVAAI